MTLALIAAVISEVSPPPPLVAAAAWSVGRWWG